MERNINYSLVNQTNKKYRMKTRSKLANYVMPVMLSLAASPSVVFAQTSVKLFDAVPVSDSGSVTDPSLAKSFGTKTLALACDTTPEALISSTSDGSGSFVADNFLTMEGNNLCTGQVDSGNLGNSAASCFINFLGNTGNALTSYTPVPPLDISENLAEGKHLVTFELMDWGGLLGSSEIWLVTNCDVYPQVGNAGNENGDGNKAIHGQLFFTDVFLPTFMDGFIKRLNPDGAALQSLVSTGGGARGIGQMSIAT